MQFQRMLASGKRSLFGWEAIAPFAALAGVHTLPRGKEQTPPKPVLPQNSLLAALSPQLEEPGNTCVALEGPSSQVGGKRAGRVMSSKTGDEVFSFPVKVWRESEISSKL